MIHVLLACMSAIYICAGVQWPWLCWRKASIILQLLPNCLYTAPLFPEIIIIHFVKYYSAVLCAFPYACTMVMLSTICLQYNTKLVYPPIFLIDAC